MSRRNWNTAIFAGFLIISVFATTDAQTRKAYWLKDNNTKAQITLYASPDGSGNLCSKEQPGSLTSLRNKVSSMTATMKGNIVINLRDGIYFLKSAFNLGPEDSGNNGYSVVWQANPGEFPVLSGGTAVTGWVLFDKNKNIYKTNVGDLKFRQLYVNVVRAANCRLGIVAGPEHRVISVVGWTGQVANEF